jgi:DNA topoisomerase-1
MEENLDRIESSEDELLKILTQFYHPFKKDLEAAAEDMLSVKGVGFSTGLDCPECQKPLHIKVGKNGPFLACSGYPDCSYSNDYTRDEKGDIQPVEISTEEVVDKSCDKCGSPMVIKRGRYGDFVACTGYPVCKNTQSLNNGANAKPTGVACPEEGCDGEVVEKSSRRGKIFYGCNRYPDCSFASWDRPVPIACPACGNAYMVEKTTKREGTVHACPNRDCRHRQPPPEG